MQPPAFAGLEEEHQKTGAFKVFLLMWDYFLFVSFAFIFFLSFCLFLSIAGLT